ncbi:MAG: ATP-dependent helicase [Bacteroidetes bacterium]|nr:MAG: ATP-dependent helicase [Bacteroidota bacterium]REK06975.1 MAG: ATP-dependent helicase [Bacteroidota bacterium]REK33677.1 MAG: ATP-dependent helicase [Bacteroidota bacterium]REK47246.1 MAG: ATP-dependent helicase [Bacteroidota bacterium]
MSFTELQLIEPLMEALKKKSYTVPTPIQSKSIPPILEGKDILGCAQTGTGKTAAFSLPMLQLLHNSKNGSRRNIRALILAPTRELATQIKESIDTYGSGLGLTHTVIFGGVSQVNQVNRLKQGVEILIATPGRLLDLMQQGLIKLNHIEFFVLDEADRMLDMGFIHDIKKIIEKLPAKRQTLLFSATFPDEIKKLSSKLLKDPVQISVTPVASTVDTVKQVVYYVNKADKRSLLKHVIKNESIDHAIVFTRTKRGADRIVRELNKSGIKSDSIHGDKSQNARERALKSFKSRSIQILVATDIASRGIDVDKLSHVINFEIPETPEAYVHRIGRTGRAGESGTALSFCTEDEMDYMKQIRKLIRKDPEIYESHPYSNR